MGLIAQAQADILRYTTSGTDFGVVISLVAPNGATATVTGYHARHHLGVDTDGNAVNSRTANAAISEYALNAVNYPIRDSNGVVNLTGHKVNVADSTGIIRAYVVQTSIPDETIGLITMTLEDFE